MRRILRLVSREVLRNNFLGSKLCCRINFVSACVHASLPFRASLTFLHLHKGYMLSAGLMGLWTLTLSVEQNRIQAKFSPTFGRRFIDTFRKQYPNTVRYTSGENGRCFILHGFHSRCAGLAQLCIVRASLRHSCTSLHHSLLPSFLEEEGGREA